MIFASLLTRIVLLARLKMKHIIFLFVVLSIVFFGENLSGSGQRITGKPAAKLLSISKINEKKLTGKVVRTEGYVVKIYRCPPCPKGVYCKPCMKNNAVISMENKQLESYVDLTEREIILFGDETEKLKRGKKYHFKIRITDRKSTGQSLNDIELLSYKSIE